uniref:uncharacterized protein LOC120325541 isoform X1 n=1 Tax=Styela clava TaxID=7725 RepID=UPI001939994A|nr:uncharacterized protein LOC120325541 isoform X1 [Styela clava]
MSKLFTMNALSFTYVLLISCFIVVCNASVLSYDVVVSELSDDKEINKVEQEIYIDEVYMLTTTPPVIEMVYEEDLEKENSFNETEFVGRSNYNLTAEEFELAFGKEGHFPEEHMNFDLGFGAGLVNSKDWSSWTCCRPVLNIRSRERVRQVPRIEMEYKKCSDGYCKPHMCKDNVNVCEAFIKSMGQGLCDKNHMMSTFMGHHCPLTCNFCGGSGEKPTEPPRPTLPPWMQNPWRPRTTKAERPIFTTPRPRITTTKRPSRPWWMTERPTTTRRPYYTTRRPRITQKPWWERKTTTTTPKPFVSGSSGLVKVSIFTHDLNEPYPSYMYSISSGAYPSRPWTNVIQGNSEISQFYLYKKPTDTYKTAVKFCSSKDSTGNRKWAVTKRRCSRGWKQEFVLYGSLFRTSESQLYYVGNRGRPHWTSRVSKKFPSNGYTSSVFYFYGPKSTDNGPTFPSRPTPRPFSTRRPIYTRPYTTSRRPVYTRPYTTSRRPIYTRPYTTTTRRPYRPQPTFPSFTTTRRTSRPIGGGPQPTDAYNRECLEAHNFFRAAHNVPALQWSSELARTAQRWADQLKQRAPERPDQARMGDRTRNWPHSESDQRGTYRKAGDGENIAWDRSGDGSPAKESVLRWYSEIFYYNRNHPTHSPAPDKPVGHLTQLLWKDTTHLGCAMATTKIGRYNQLSTWSVAHYRKGGNMRYSNSMSATLRLYNEQVPDMRAGSCMTRSGACNNGNQCMAFGPAQGSCACTNQLASCRSNNGCIAWCKNRGGNWNWSEECRGANKCSCTSDRGAVCT